MAKAMEGEEGPLASFNLVDVEPIHFTKLKDVTEERINELYEEMAKMRSGGELFSRNATAESARDAMEALNFLNIQNKYQPISYEMSSEDIAVSLKTQLWGAGRRQLFVA